MTTTFTQEQIVKKFVYLDLPEEGYNNQDFYQMSDETQRYVLATCELPYDDRKLKEGQEKNKFYKFQKIEQRKNIELKKTLINEVKDILEKDDWNDFNNRMKEIQKDWKDIGFSKKNF